MDDKIIETVAEINPTTVSDEVKTQVITEYLKSLLSQAPKINLSGVGVEISSPKSKPKTFAEAAKYTAEKLSNKQ